MSTPKTIIKGSPSPKNPEKSTVVRNVLNVSIAESPAIPFTIDCAQILTGSMSAG